VSEISYPTAGGGGVTDAVYERLMAGMTSDGQIGSVTAPSLCYADSSGRQVKIRANREAIVRGFYYNSGDVGLSLAVPTNTTGKTRIDRVVLRLDRNNYTVRAKLITGTASAKPVAPAHIQQLAPDRYWDLPIALVTVPTGFTGLAPSAVVNTGYYISESGLMGPSWARPRAVPGMLFRDTQTDRLYMGNETGTWRTLYYDSGWQTVAAASGWKNATPGMKVRRKSGWVCLMIDVIRTAGDLAKTASSTIATLPEAYRPDISMFSTAAVSNPDHVTHMKILNTGKVTLEANHTHEVTKGAYVIGQLVYPMTES
jgi:hypothetical protein